MGVGGAQAPSCLTFGSISLRVCKHLILFFTRTQSQLYCAADFLFLIHLVVDCSSRMISDYHVRLHAGRVPPISRDLPLVGSLCTGIFGRFLGYRGAAVFTTCFVFFAFLFSCSAFYEVALCASPCYIKLAPWFISEMFDAYWGFLFDSLTVVMCVVVTLVSTLVHMYGIS